MDVIPTSGTWAESGYLSYIDTQLGEAINVTRIILEQVNSDRPDEAKPPDIAKIKKGIIRIPGDLPNKQKNPLGDRDNLPRDAPPSKLITASRLRLSSEIDERTLGIDIVSPDSE